MDFVTELLRQHAALAFAWKIMVFAFAAFLVSLGVVAFVQPAVARRFLGGYVSSPLVNFVEAALRLCAGLGLMGASPDMRLSSAFFWFGAILSATAIPMMFLYDLHKRQAGWAIGFAQRILPLYGLSALALGGFVVWALV
jgi:hypothetical protein